MFRSTAKGCKLMQLFRIIFCCIFHLQNFWNFLHEYKEKKMIILQFYQLCSSEKVVTFYGWFLHSSRQHTHLKSIGYQILLNFRFLVCILTSLCRKTYNFQYYSFLGPKTQTSTGSNQPKICMQGDQINRQINQMCTLKTVKY